MKMADLYFAVLSNRAAPARAQSPGDPLFGKMGSRLAEKRQAAHRRAELHAHQSGAHGFGIGKSETTSTSWIESSRLWLGTNVEGGQRK